MGALKEACEISSKMAEDDLELCAPDFVPLRGAPFAVLACGPPAGRAKKSRVVSRARAQEEPLDVAR